MPVPAGLNWIVEAHAGLVVPTASAKLASRSARRVFIDSSLADTVERTGRDIESGDQPT
jgi:hypothetical protein